MVILARVARILLSILMLPVVGFVGLLYGLRVISAKRFLRFADRWYPGAGLLGQD